MATRKKTKKGGAKVGMGIGLAAAAAAAGAYFFYGTKEAQKHRKKLRGWAVKMKGDVLDQIERLKDVDQEAYDKIINEASKTYSKLQGVSSKEVAEVAKELKSSWKKIHAELTCDEKPKKKSAVKKRLAAKKKPVAKKAPAKKKPAAKKSTRKSAAKKKPAPKTKK